MRKWWLLLLALLVIGGGYFGFNFYKNQATPVNNEVKAEDKNLKKETTKISEEESDKPTETNVETDKEWEFSFPEPLNPSTVNSTNITVKDNTNKLVTTTIQLTNENKTIKILAPSGGYKKGELYNLHIENGISYANGNPVSKPYDLTFEVDRDEVEKAVLNKNLIFAKESQMNSVNGNIIDIDKSVKKDLKVNDIIIIPSKTIPEGKAVKVTKIESNSSNYIIETTKPAFVELYENLDINKTYDISPENIELEKGIKGVTINPISQSEQHTLIASTNAKKDKNNGPEYKIPKVHYKYSESKGFEFNLEDLIFTAKKQSLTLNGSIVMLDPKVDTDIDIKLFKMKKMKVTAKNHMEQDTTLKLEDYAAEGKRDLISKKYIDKYPEFVPKRIKDKLKLAKFTIPTNVPGVSIKGGIYLQAVAGIKGEQQIKTTIEIDNERGFIYKDKKSKPINKFDRKINVSYKGNSSSSVALGPLAKVEVSAYGTIASGVEGFFGYKIEGQFAQGMSLEQAYICGIYSEAISGDLSYYIDLGFPGSKDPHRIYEYKIGQKDFWKKEYNNCMAYKGIESDVKSLDMKSGDEINVKVIADYLNLLTSKHEKEKIKDYTIVKTSFSNKDVVKAKKKKKSLTLTALGTPSSKTTKLTIKYSEKSKVFKKKRTGTITIPITITDYDEIAKKAAEAKAEEEAKLSSLKGEWSLVNDFGGSTLNILDVKNNQLQFEINASSGGHANGFEGTTAKIKNDEALYVDEDTDCHINFVLDKKDTITVYESPECNLNDVSIEGDYKKGQQQQPEQKSLTELTNGEISEERDEAIRNLVGEDYNIFVTNTQQYVVDEEEDVDAFGSTVITAAVPGLYKYNEAIYMLTTPGDLFVATIVDGEKVRFYTDNELYQDKLPLTIQNWMSRFSDYPVEYRYKPITEQ